MSIIGESVWFLYRYIRLKPFSYNRCLQITILHNEVGPDPKKEII